MECVNNTNKGSKIMGIIRKLLPWVALAAVGFTLGYLYSGTFRDKANEKIEEVKHAAEDIGEKTSIILDDEWPKNVCPPETVCEACPEVSCPTVKCPVAKAPPPKIVYRDRIVEVPVPVKQYIKPGCTVTNWKTGEVVARNKPGQSLDCHVNTKTRKIDEYHFHNGKLRRGPYPNGVLDDAVKAYDRRRP